MESDMAGKRAEDFSLKDQDDEEFRLSGFIGRKVLLSFHPLAWTSVCAGQMKDLEDRMETFDRLDTVPVGISVDSVPCKKAWAKSLEIERLTLLSDFWPHGGVAKKFRVFREEDGIANRANVLVDEEGKVTLVKVYEIKERPDLGEIVDFLER
ncbi:MAG: redoxin domain-containing protein [Methanomassiliicoccales archaeon]